MEDPDHRRNFGDFEISRDILKTPDRSHKIFKNSKRSSDSWSSLSVFLKSFSALGVEFFFQLSCDNLKNSIDYSLIMLALQQCYCNCNKRKLYHYLTKLVQFTATNLDSFCYLDDTLNLFYGFF